jgi:WD40 repeat protein
VSVAAFCPVAKAGLLDGLLGLPSSGKVAKYEFSLKEDFPVTSIAWSPDGRYIADSSTQRGSVNVWSVQERRIVQRFTFDTFLPYFHSLAFSPDGRYLAFCDGSSKLRIYDASNWEIRQLLGEARQGFCLGRVAFSDDSALLAVDGNEFTLLSTSSWGKQKIVDPKWHLGRQLHVFAFLRGSHDLLLGGSARYEKSDVPESAPTGGGGVFWILRESDSLPSKRVNVYFPMPITHYNSNVYSIAVSPDGKLVATGAATGDGPKGGVITDAIRFFYANNLNIVGKSLDQAHVGRQGAIEFTPDSRYLVVVHDGGDSRRVSLIDASDFRLIEFVLAGGQVYDISVDPTGGRFAAGAGSEIDVWNIQK